MSHDEDNPEVIRAKAEAKARILEARAKLHPVSQAIYTIMDQFNSTLKSLGCLIIILVGVLLFFGVDIIKLVGQLF